MLRLPSMVLAAALATATPSFSCDLALALAIDDSHSIDNQEAALIRESTTKALKDPVLGRTLVRGQVYIQAFLFGLNQEEITGWTLIETPDDLRRFADSLPGSRIKGGTGKTTSIGNAMAYGLRQFQERHCDRNVLDILTDGLNNDGRTPAEVRNEFGEEHQVNVLFIGNNPRIVSILDQDVRLGFGSFLIQIETAADVERAMARKLLMEISMNIPR